MKTNRDPATGQIGRLSDGAIVFRTSRLLRNDRQQRRFRDRAHTVSVRKQILPIEVHRNLIELRLNRLPVIEGGGRDLDHPVAGPV